MALIADGTFTGSPDEHMIFISVIYGHALTFLHQHMHGIEWHGVLLTVLQLVAFTVLCYHYLSRYRKNYGLGLLIFVLFYYLTINLQFTSVTVLLAFTGILSFVTYQHSKGRWLGAILIILSSIIRFEAFAMLVMVMLPFVAINQWAYVRKSMLYIGLVLSLISIGKYINYLAYQNPDWQEYNAYNAMRGRLNDNENMGGLVSNPKQLKQLGVTETEIRLYHRKNDGNR
jgi:hypothetical protein